MLVDGLNAFFKIMSKGESLSYGVMHLAYEFLFLNKIVKSASSLVRPFRESYTLSWSMKNAKIFQDRKTWETQHCVDQQQRSSVYL